MLKIIKTENSYKPIQTHPKSEEHLYLSDGNERNKIDALPANHD